jgi:hypothetical protein
MKHARTTNNKARKKDKWLSVEEWNERIDLLEINDNLVFGPGFLKLSDYKICRNQIDSQIVLWDEIL